MYPAELDTWRSSATTGLAEPEEDRSLHGDVAVRRSLQSVPDRPENVTEEQAKR